MSSRLDVTKYNTAAILLCAYLLLGVAMLLATAESIGFYRSTYWVIDYGLGFVRRGLVGEVAEGLFGPLANTERFIHIAAFCVGVVAVFMYSLLAALATARHSSAEALGFVILGLLGGQMMAQVGFDLGNFDQFGFIAATLILVLLLRTLHPIAMLASGCLLALSVFVHEAIVVVHAPLLLVLAWIELRRRGGSTSALLLLSLPMFAAAVVLSVVGIHDVTPNELCQYYSGTADFPLDCRVQRILTEDLRQTVVNTLKTVRNPKYGYFGATVVMLVIFSAWQLVLACILRVRERSGYRLALLAAGSPIVLCFIGIDYYRWLHLALTNGLLLALFVAATVTEDPFQGAFRRSKWIVAASICVVLIASYVPGAAVEKPHPPDGYLRIFLGRLSG